MTLGSRGQLHVFRPVATCLLTCFKRSSSKFYITLHIFRAYILCKAYGIQSPRKYFPNTFTSSQDGMVQVIAQCLTHKSKRVIYLTVGDHCRVFPLYRMYECVDNAVVIWCWTSG